MRLGRFVRTAALRSFIDRQIIGPVFARMAPMADPRGKSSNHFDDLFAELEEWELILKSLDEFPVKDDEPPAPRI
jgi:hypothetical protein